MTYKPINWKDRIVEKPNTFETRDNGDNTVTLIPDPGQVLQEGTPLNAENLNHIEKGLIAAYSQLEQKANKEELQKISLSYKESYNTLTLLNNAYPNGDIYNHTVLEDGFIYTYKNGWVSTGIQANGTGIPQIDISKINQYGILSNNIYNYKTNIKGYLNVSNGQVVDNNDFYTSDFIQVEPSTKYVIKRTWYVAYYGANKTLISCVKLQNVNTIITTYSNCNYIRFSQYKIELEQELNQVNKGDILKDFDDFKIGISEDVLGLNYSNKISEIINKIDSINKALIEVNLPNKIYGVVGKELNIYFDNILDNKIKNKYFIDISDGYIGGKQLEDRWSYTPTNVGTFTLEIKFFDESYTKVYQKNITVEILEKTKGSGIKKALVIGDSTVASGGNTYQLIKAFENDSVTLELLGTKGSGTNKHEGKDGRTTTYLRQLNTDNLFFNPSKNDFDFSYYMTQQNYSSVDFVIINLGINDVFGQESDDSANYMLNSTTIPNLNFIINNIKEYNSNIKIIINIPIPPNSSQNPFGNVRKSGETQWRYKRNNFLMQKAYISNFDNKISGVYVCPINAYIDTVNQIEDHVHPKASNNFEGYVGIGLMEYFTIKSLT